MFDSGSSQLKPYAKDLLHELSKTLNGVDQSIGLAGHTDAASLRVWRQELQQLGTVGRSRQRDATGAGRRRTRGQQDHPRRRASARRSSAKPEAPLDPANRRVTIVVLNQVTKDRIGHDGVELESTSCRHRSRPTRSRPRRGRRQDRRRRRRRRMPHRAVGPAAAASAASAAPSRFTLPHSSGTASGARAASSEPNRSASVGRPCRTSETNARRKTQLTSAWSVADG